MSASDDIFALAAILAPAADAAALRRVCAAATQELSGKLKAGTTAADCGESFICAAASLAAAFFAAAEETASFSAGEVSVQKRGADSRADALRRQAERIMTPFCRGGFRFAGVEG